MAEPWRTNDMTFRSFNGTMFIFLWPVCSYIVILIYFNIFEPKGGILIRRYEDFGINVSIFLAFGLCLWSQTREYARSQLVRKIVNGCLWAITFGHPLFRLMLVYCVETSKEEKQVSVDYCIFWITVYLLSNLVSDGHFWGVNFEEIDRNNNISPLESIETIYGIDYQPA